MRKSFYLFLFLFIPLAGVSQPNIVLPASTSTSGQIRIGGKVVLHTYGINNYFAAGSGNFIMQQQGTNNVGIGLESLRNNLLGDNNTAIGHYAGKTNRYGAGNIFIGFNAGNNSTFSDLNNRLIIDNTTTSIPFIYGNMTPGSRVLTVNADFTVTGDDIKFPNIPKQTCLYVLNYDSITGKITYGDVSGIGKDTLYVQYECDPEVSSGMRLNGDTIFIDTCYAGIDTCLFYLVDTTIINKNNYNLLIDSKIRTDSIQAINGIGEKLYILSPTEVSDNIFLTDSYVDGNNITTIYFGQGLYNSIVATDSLIEIIAGKNIKFYAGANIFYLDSTGFYPSHVPGANQYPIGKPGNEWEGVYTTNITDDSTNVFVRVPYKEYDTALVILNDTVAKRVIPTSSEDTCLWAKTGNDLYPKDLADSIGIGKNNPDEMLDVNGNVQIPATSTTIGQIKQNNSTLIHTYGTENYFFGVANGNFSMGTSTHNIGIGGNGLRLLSTGDQNISIGYTALEAVSSGSKNIAIGYAALSKVQTVNNNIAIGMNCFQNTTVANNTGVGYYAGQDISSGTDNVALGYYALNNSTSSFFNVAIGSGAMGNAPSEAGKADNEVAIGYQAAYTDSTGTDNVSIGYKANWSAKSGTKNTFIGGESGYSNVGNSSSVAVGYRAMYNADNRKTGRETYNTAIGYEALKGSGTVASNTGQNNTAIGYQSLYSVSSGYQNSAVGPWSLVSNTTGALNSAFGNSALFSNSTGSFNCAFGDGALASNVGGVSNCAFGISSLASNTGDVNCAFGSSSLIGNTDGQENSGFGNGVLYNNSSGNFNTALGGSSMYGTYSYSQTGNVAVGYMTLRDVNDNANYNTVIGYMAADSLTTGDGNVIIGNEAGGKLTTESNQLYIENSNSATPLIGGDFSTNTVYINDILRLNPVDTAAAVSGTIYIDSDDNDLWYYKDGTGWVKLN